MGVELAAGFALEAVAEVAAGVPSGLDIVAPWVAGGGTLAGATAADRTFAVMLADPAELGLDPEEAGAPVAGIVGGAVVTAGAVPAALELETTTALVLGAVAFVVAGAVGFEGVAGAMLTAIDAEALPFVEVAGLAVAVVCAASVGDDELIAGFTLPWVPAAFCAPGTVPAPGVPIPGKTVPCCRLPSFGRAADGAVVAAVAAGCVATAGCFSGKLMGGNLGGTGIEAGAAADSVGACGLRRNTSISGALAAGAGPFLRAAEAVSAA
jgi:hypothetical protein